MEYLKGTATQIPPLIIIRGTEFSICGSGHDTCLWLNPKTMRHSNAFVIHDPDGRLRKRYCKAFCHRGFDVKVLNLTNLRASERYNPFAYIRSDIGVAKVAAALICGTEGLGLPDDIDFLAREILLYTALISYIHSEAPLYEMNIATLKLMLEYISEHEEDFKTAVDFLFEQMEERDPEHLSVRLYKNIKASAGKNAQRIVESCAARLAPLDTAEINDLLSSDELVLHSLTFPKTALFVTSGNTGSALDELGAADERDDVFGCLSFCPITDLGHADGAYEWQYDGLPALSPFNPQPAQMDKQVTAALAAEYESYINGKGWKGRGDFGGLTAGNLADYLLREYLAPACKRFILELQETDREKYLAENLWISWVHTSA